MTIKRLLVATAALFGLALSACAAPVATTVADAPPVDAVSGPALWQLADEDTTIYLFGTVHVLPDGIEWYDQRIARAFEASDVLVTEVDVGDQAAMASYIAGAAALESGQTLRGLMADDSRVKYEAALTVLGLPVNALDSYEPWFAALNLSVLPLLQAGYNPTTGVEMALAARAAGKQRDELETIEQQIGLFDGMAMEYQLTYLDATVEGMDEVVPMVNEMVSVWLQGDAVRLAEIMNSEMDDDYLYNRLLIDRNTTWVQWIERRMEQPGTVFLAVGAGHLAGAGSVQDQLEQRGHTVTRIWK
ncbi:TraB/GumN family protein [Altererythrobacter sp. KTW20L]|uniref:TraB/GumN family protein n=1 Tax=Altererythrobacter sp. KTW20L TaxID=2942210 RepID=UPI0020BDB0BE|nr:TraB/GumN family protein [Altererythrobacter sp. KTW20L]MCL6251987.1 TraB/GumN family protein [Altererythrobacter sp. KTW20L]